MKIAVRVKRPEVAGEYYWFDLVAEQIATFQQMGIASQWIGIRVHKAALNLLSPFRTVSMNIALPIITFYPRVAVVGLTIFFAVTLVGCASPPNWIPTSGESHPVGGLDGIPAHK
ncbi:hypothetical protein [Candidatus Aalborgicola defluviihabitans]|uniref:hypothetical protein n=1 Tax=Candidatus Aalborgicola defluviihabitans TaxID=3386187 RepID=UPI0039B955FD